MIEIKRISSDDPAFREKLTEFAVAGWEPDSEQTTTVAAIIREVRQRGDHALVEYTNRYDRRQVAAADLEIPAARVQAAVAEIPEEMQRALRYACERVRQYHEHQKEQSWSYVDGEGTMLGQQVRPMERAGVYVPGGRAAYPSSVLMNVIPARVAGVSEVIMVVPAPAGELNPLVLAAAAIAGVDRLFAIGGAQAIAALAYGTESVPAVDKIVGPGNKYVAEAKRQVFGAVGIDMIAGPSEVLVVSDGSSDPDWVAMDLFAQSEHDEDARALLISTDDAFINRVLDSIERLLPGMERADIIRSALNRNGVFIKVNNLDEAVEIVNLIAPEHLELSVDEPEPLLAGITHAGAIFMGKHTAEVLGDYCAGPNHVLPTAGTARFSSPLGVYDFQKRSSLIKCSAGSVTRLAETASILAEGEGLTAHAQSAKLRIAAGSGKRET